jgi:hypothetical protein
MTPVDFIGQKLIATLMFSLLLRDFAQCHLQPIDVDRFDQVFGKTDGPTFLQIVFHSESAKSNSGDRLFRANLPHQIVSAAVGQSNVADQQIEF